ncbi:hypothetical protein FACS189456_4750 [Bacteroidia bacterium]|nr:hypothetical protein FACS189456_4750 [Bacteroidia bacterium]
MDVNTDPNNPSTAPIKMVIPVAQTSTASNYNWFLMTYGSIWAEHFSQNFTSHQYDVVNDYNPQPDAFNNLWAQSFSEGLNDWKFVLTTAEEAEDWAAYLVATCMTAFQFAFLVDCFDQVPYSEGLQGKEAVFAPKFDDGSTVYADLIRRLNDAVSKDFSLVSNSQLGTSDFVFAGDVNKWKAFANTLKLKLYLRQTNVANVTANLTECLNSPLGFVSEALISGFTNEAGKRNPWFGVNLAPEGLGTPNFRASNVLMDYLKNANDARIGGIFTPGSGAGGVFNSMVFGGRLNAEYVGVADANGLANTIATPNIKTTDPVYFFTKAQVYFMTAEAKERTGQSGQADYEAGVTASFVDFGATAADAAALLVADYAYPTGTLEDKVEAIITQQWVASAVRLPIEAWFDYNRTGYPRFLVPSANTQLGGALLPKRFFYPATEVARNVNTPPQKEISTPVWWGK